MSPCLRSVRLVMLGCAANLALALPSAWGEPITYKLVDYPLDQGGHHLSGTIVAAGVSANLWGSQVLGGAFTIDGESFSIGRAFGYEANPRGIGPIVTATEILLPPMGFFLIEHPAPEGSNEWQTITWNRSWRYEYSAKSETTYPGPTYWWNVTPASDPGHIAANESWIIATVVPEPSGVVLLSSSAVSLLFSLWLGVRRRRLQAGGESLSS